VYIGTSIDRDKGKNEKGLSYITKLNGATGDIIWQREYECRVTKQTDGGFTSPVCLGTGSLSDYVFTYVTGCDGSADKKAGRLVALSKKTGGEKYTVDFKYYSVSAPICAYGADGKGYLIISDCRGNLFMLDGESGKSLNIRKIGERITTDPVIYENTLIIGSESKIYGIKLE
jgi:outer membrane protein assembly factor BamB